MQRASEARKIGRLPALARTPEHGARTRTPRTSQPWDVALDESPLTGGLDSLAMPTFARADVYGDDGGQQGDQDTDEDEEFVPHNSDTDSDAAYDDDAPDDAYAAADLPEEAEAPSDQGGDDPGAGAHPAPPTPDTHAYVPPQPPRSAPRAAHAPPARPTRPTPAQRTAHEPRPTTTPRPVPSSVRAHTPRTPAHVDAELPADDYYAKIDFDKITDPFTDTRRAQMRGLRKTHEMRTAQPPAPAPAPRTPTPPQEPPHVSPPASPAPKRDAAPEPSPPPPASPAARRAPPTPKRPAPRASVRAEPTPPPPRAQPTPVSERRAPAAIPAQIAPSPVPPAATPAPRPAARPTPSPAAAPSPAAPRTSAPPRRVSAAAPAPPADAQVAEPSGTRGPSAQRPRASVAEALRARRSLHADAATPRTPARPTRSNRLLTEELLKWKRRCAQLEDELREAQQHMDDLRQDAQLGDYAELEAQVAALQRGRDRDRRAMRQRVRVLESHMAETKLKYDERYWRLLTSSERTPDADSADVRLVVCENEVLQLQSANAELARELRVVKSHASFLLGLYKWRGEQAGGDAAQLAQLQQRLDDETRARQRAERRLQELQLHAPRAASLGLDDDAPEPPPPAVLDESAGEASSPAPDAPTLPERPAPRPRVRRPALTQGRPRKKADTSSSPPAPPLETFGIAPSESPRPEQSATPEPALLQPGMTPMLRRAGAPSALALDVESTPMLDAGDASPARKKKRKLLSANPNFLRLNEASATLSPGHDLLMPLSPAQLP